MNHLKWLLPVALLTTTAIVFIIKAPNENEEIDSSNSLVLFAFLYPLLKIKKAISKH